MNWEKRQYAGDLNASNKDESVTCCGWVDTIRDHGHLLFIHLRDVKGVVQIVFDQNQKPDIYKQAQQLRSEDCISIEGHVIEREEEAKNRSLPTGEIELHVDQLTVFSKSETPPFVITEKSQIDDDATQFNVDEDLRLTYRYLDLRRPSMQRQIQTRYQILKAIRDYLDAQEFIDIETPILTKSTPEGARDYLVPSRQHPTNFYALPQSPQMFKQLLMVSGFDRYYQIVRCFRDEDLRPNRQPEFTQLDLEASFIDETFIYQLFEPLIVELFALVGKTIQAPFPHITYEEAMEKYGNDHPDCRFGLELVDVTETCQHVGYRIFQSIVSAGGAIKGFNVKGKAEQMSKSMLQEELAKKVVPKLGGKGMSWMKVEDGKLVSNIVQFFKPEEQEALMQKMNAENGDVLLFIADTDKALVNDVCGRLRLHVGQQQGFIDSSVISPCWVTEFPMFELKDGRLSSMHHPFTQPSDDFVNATSQEALLNVKSRAYDLVINGEEVGGGSIRIHDADVQAKIFDVLGFTKEDIEEKFGFFVQALRYGTPPHGGIALGLDRLVSMITDAQSIREVIAFPKNRTAYCPLTQAPSRVDPSQLQDLDIQCVEREEITH